MSPKILVTIKQLSLGLLGDMVASLWEPKSIEHAWPNPSPNQPIKHLMPLIKPFQKEKKPCPEMKEKPYLFPFMEYFQTHAYKIHHLWLNLEVHWLKGKEKT